MKKSLLVLCIFLMFSSFAVEDNEYYFFLEPTEVKKFVFLEGEVMIDADNQIDVRINYLAARTFHNQQGEYAFMKWKNIKVFVDVDEKEKDWLVYNMEKEGVENWYFEIHITKSTFEDIEITVKKELENKGLLDLRE